MSNNKRIIKKKKWVIECITYHDGTVEMNRTNDGFSPFELMGLLEFTKNEVINQINGDFKPDVVNRTLIEGGEDEN